MYQVCLEESLELPLALLIPEDGFSSDVVRGIPAGLVDFLSPLQGAGMCRLAAQPTSIGLWTVYMHQYNVNFVNSFYNSFPRLQFTIFFFFRLFITANTIVKCNVNEIATARSSSYKVA